MIRRALLFIAVVTFAGAQVVGGAAQQATPAPAVDPLGGGACEARAEAAVEPTVGDDVESGPITVAPSGLLPVPPETIALAGATVEGVYACVAADDDAGVDSYFTPAAREAFGAPGAASDLLAGDGAPEGYKVVSALGMRDGRIVANLTFAGPAGSINAIWVMVESGEDLLIDAIVVPASDGATPVATPVS